MQVFLTNHKSCLLTLVLGGKSSQDFKEVKCLLLYLFRKCQNTDPSCSAKTCILDAAALTIKQNKNGFLNTCKCLPFSQMHLKFKKKKTASPFPVFSFSYYPSHQKQSLCCLKRKKMEIRYLCFCFFENVILEKLCVSQIQGKPIVDLWQYLVVIWV